MDAVHSKLEFPAGRSESEQLYEIRSSLWTSLIEKLGDRVFLLEALGQLKNAHVQEDMLHECTVIADGGHVSIWLHAEDGNGSWSVVSKSLDTAEPWFLSPTGVFEIDGEKMSLSSAAERFVAKVSGQWTTAQ